MKLKRLLFTVLFILAILLLLISIPAHAQTTGQIIWQKKTTSGAQAV